MQTKLQSLIETTVGTAIAICVAIQAQLIVFPWYGINIQPVENFQIVMWFTIISFIRSYLVRRTFNYIFGD